MKLVSHLSVGAAALAVGGVAAGTITNAKDKAPADAAPVAATAATQPEQVRTVIETRTIHRTKHVKAKARRASAPKRRAVVHAVVPAVAPPARQAAAPAPVVRVSAPAPAAAPVRRAVKPVSTHTSGGSGSSGEHEDEYEREDHGDDGEHEGGEDD